jgi:hypothetical protein
MAPTGAVNVASTTNTLLPDKLILVCLDRLTFDQSLLRSPWDIVLTAAKPNETTRSTRPRRRRMSGAAATPQNTRRSSSSPHPNAIVDPYQVLQVRRDATHSEIRQAYRRLSLWYHPGRRIVAVATAATNSSSSKNRAQQQQMVHFATLAACYETLVDVGARRRCDTLCRDLEILQKIQQQTTSWPVSGDIRVGGRKLLHMGGSGGGGTDQYNYYMGNKAMGTAPALSPVSSQSSGDEGDVEEEGKEDAKMEQSPDAQRRRQHVKAQRRSPRRRLKRRTVHFQPQEGKRRTVHFQTQEDKTGKNKRDKPPIRMLGCCHAPPASDNDDYMEETMPFAKTHHILCSHEDDDSSQNDDEYQTAIRSLLRNSSSTGENDAQAAADNIHYTAVETNRLFGGPLQLLFRARRWKPFTDPFVVFSTIFGNNHSLGRGSETNSSLLDAENESNSAVPSFHNTAADKTTPLVLYPHHAVTALSGESFRVSDDVTVFRKVRNWTDRRIVRTEVVRTNPRGKTMPKHSTVTVTTEYLDGSSAGTFSSSEQLHALPCWDDRSKNQAANGAAYYCCGGGSPAPSSDAGGGNRVYVVPSGPDEDGIAWSFTAACQSWLPSCVH